MIILLKYTYTPDMLGVNFDKITNYAGKKQNSPHDFQKGLIISVRCLFIRNRRYDASARQMADSADDKI